MFEWTPEDEAAEKEGSALKRANRTARPRKPHGINREDVKCWSRHVITKQDSAWTRI